MRVTSNLGDAILDLRRMAEDLPETMEDDFAQDAVNIMTDIPRNYMPAAHRHEEQQSPNTRATGRLWSGWGERRNVQTTNPASTDADNVVEIVRSQDEVDIKVGTTIRYAGYVNVGRPFGQGRPAYSFTEKGNEQIEYELQRAIEFYADELIEEEKLSVGSSIRARGRQRDVMGRFI